MLRIARLTIGVVVLIAVAATDAHAQWYYPIGYGPYGWGGWGSTPPGDMAMGLGAFAAGEGQYNLNTAQANAINADTVMRWNQANWQTQHAINVSYYYRRLRRREQNNKAQAAIYDRLRNNPNPYDIENGDALNVALDELFNPKVYGSTVRMIKTPLSNQIIRAIPFEHSSEAVTICMQELTAKEGWPEALRSDTFAPARKELQEAIQDALAEDEKAELKPETIERVEQAVAKLDAKFKEKTPQTSPGYIQAKNYIKTLTNVARMLQSPKVEEILAGIEKYPGTTVGDLLSFMYNFNLRFAPAKTEQQRQIYQDLYVALDQARDRALAKADREAKKTAENTPKDEEESEGTKEKSMSSAAKSFFEAMNGERPTVKPKPSKP